MDPLESGAEQTLAGGLISSDMGKKALVAGAVVIAVLLAGSFLVFAPAPASSALTVRHIKSLQSGTNFTETFEITNNTTTTYCVAPTVVFLLDGQVRRVCFDLMSHLSPGLIVGPHACVSSSFQMIGLPPSIPLRLSVSAQPDLTGPRGWLTRLKLRYVEHQNIISANPFSNRNPIFGLRKSVNIDSDPFIELEAKVRGPEGSAK